MCNCSKAEKNDTKKFEKVCSILEEFDYSPAKLIPILQKVQGEYRYLPQEVLAFVASSLGLPAAKVYGVATFYANFALEPKGKNVIHICDGTACHVKGSEAIINAFREKLGLSAEKLTTDDMKFTVETVSCLGACGLAPVITVNEKVHGLMTPEKVDGILEEIRKGEDGNGN